MSDDNLLELTAEIVAAHLSSNTVAANDVPTLIKSVHGALSGLGAPVPEPEVKQEPAVSIRASIKPDYIVCLEDGKKLKMLKRHLMTHYQMTPGEYRAKWNLPADYPMVAPNYANQRKELALKIGLGQKRKAAPAPEPVASPKAAPAPKAAAARKAAAAAAAAPAPKTRKPRARKAEA
ncbi:Ros/MucR family transcriptional regulator [Rhizorhabdus argentea]|uniref:MucR family transcriptional regulator n=1 Tax=Rhizorhabdus argentea TaxID=1387174 RepID=UPI0030EB45DC